MTIDRFSLLSPEPVKIPYIGGVRAPSLREIARIGYPLYQSYLSLLSLDKASYYRLLSDEESTFLSQYAESSRDSVLKLKSEYEALTPKEKERITFFDLFTFDKPLCSSICQALNFFLEEQVIFDEKRRVFLTYSPSAQSPSKDEDQPSGAVTPENYPLAADVILQRACVRNRETDWKNSRVKNRTAARLLKKMEKGRKEKRPKEDRRMDLANVVSALASHHNSLNMANIWELTVFQLYDQFNRQLMEDSYNIQSMNVAAYGNSGGKFDPSMWFSAF